MKKLFQVIFIITLSLFATFAKAVEPSYQSASKKEKSPSILDRREEFQRRAARATGAMKEFPPPRHVQRYAKPEIVIKGSKIFFDGKSLEFGRPLTSWKTVIRRNPRCDETGMQWCVWDELGLKVSTRINSSFGVSTIIIKLNAPEPFLNETGISNSEATSDNTSKAEWIARHPFTGYLEIDGFGIDKETKFREIQLSIDSDRNISCGLRNCEFPSGIFGPGSIIDLHLNGKSDSATIEKIKIYKTSY